ncbi:MAG: BON domain-containing protein [Pseudonocardiales bacterium]|jgi:osmotically-inducible protein OsmY|nr:BON domain-containing protein [Pseudonocardiales bacterium]MBV9650855.1 BON domain-containing protein [Pseudonocardiales bacterium]
MTVAAISHTDEQIQDQVLAELEWDPRVRSTRNGVTVKDGVVTLTGWVDSYVKKLAAQRAACRARGARAVVNDIKVRLPTFAQRTDSEIAAEARRALARHALVPGERIQVTVSKGVITLGGEVTWEFEKRAAEGAVLRLVGVRGVVNNIEVRPPVGPSPEQLTHQIAEALVRTAETDAQQVSVEVQGDKVILRGTVCSWGEREEAERVAWSAPGVTTVENHITVVP